ncbi:MAG: hypothetical protein WBZ33_07685, partial [Thermoactinomyces sp.]
QNEGEKAGIDTLGALALRALCGEQTHAPASFARARSLVLKRPCIVSRQGGKSPRLKKIFSNTG